MPQIRTALTSRAARVALALLLLASIPTLPSSAAPSQEQACNEPTRALTMYAEELPPGDDGTGLPRLGWGLTPDTAAYPGPTIEMWEGECIAITVVNDISAQTLIDYATFYGGDTSDPAITLHVHGVKYTQASDGTRHTGSIVRPGEARTYKWYAAPRVTVGGRVVSLGTAGYWWYHDHVVGTDHGTGGLRAGLFGGLVVRRPGDLLPDRPPFVVVMGPNATINLEHYPNTPKFQAVLGERIEFLVFTVGDDFHTFHLHGHNWANTRTGALLHQLDETQVIDAKTVGPSESFGFQAIAGQDVGPGAWMFHCHVQVHSDQGMVAFLEVLDVNGQSVSSTSVGDLMSHNH